MSSGPYPVSDRFLGGGLCRLAGVFACRRREDRRFLLSLRPREVSLYLNWTSSWQCGAAPGTRYSSCGTRHSSCCAASRSWPALALYWQSCGPRWMRCPSLPSLAEPNIDETFVDRVSDDDEQWAPECSVRPPSATESVYSDIAGDDFHTASAHCSTASTSAAQLAK